MPSDLYKRGKLYAQITTAFADRGAPILAVRAKPVSDNGSMYGDHQWLNSAAPGSSRETRSPRHLVQPACIVCRFDLAFYSGWPHHCTDSRFLLTPGSWWPGSRKAPSLAMCRRLVTSFGTGSSCQGS